MPSRISSSAARTRWKSDSCRQPVRRISRRSRRRSSGPSKPEDDLTRDRKGMSLSAFFFAGLFDLGFLSEVATASFTRLVIGVCTAFFSFGLLLTRVYAAKYVGLAELPAPDAYRRTVVVDHAGEHEQRCADAAKKPEHKIVGGIADDPAERRRQQHAYGRRKRVHALARLEHQTESAREILRGAERDVVVLPRVLRVGGKRQRDADAGQQDDDITTTEIRKPGRARGCQEKFSPVDVKFTGAWIPRRRGRAEGTTLSHY